MDKQWFVLHTLTGQENKAQKSIDARVKLERMEDYIKTQKDSESRLVEFASVQKVAKAKGSLYPLTKKWFLETYPEYKENSVAAAEIGNNAAVNLKVAV